MSTTVMSSRVNNAHHKAPTTSKLETRALEGGGQKDCDIRIELEWVRQERQLQGWKCNTTQTQRQKLAMKRTVGNKRIWHHCWPKWFSGI